MPKTIPNPCFLARGKIVDIDLDKKVLHTVTDERMTEEYFERLADEAENAQKAEAYSPVAQVTPLRQSRVTVPA
jgi:hypothetical protein